MITQTEATERRTTPLRNPSKRLRHKQEHKDSRARENTINLDHVRAWAQAGCTQEEIAGLLGVSRDWLYDALRKSPDLEEAIIAGQSDLKLSLRSAQVRLALSGHAGMLIWLGKQLLGQADKQEVKQETVVNVVLQQAMREMRELPTEDVLMIRGIIEQQNETGAPETDAPADGGIVGG